MQASTDCERWIASYKAELAHAKAVKKLEAAHARMKRLAQRKLAVYLKKPAVKKPAPVLAHSIKPKLTREQMLERFNLLCGDLPGDVLPIDKLAEGQMTPIEMAQEMKPFLPLEPTVMDDGGFIPPVDLTPYVPSGTPVASGAGSGGGTFNPPMYGGGGFPGSNGGKGSSGSSGGDTGTGTPGQFSAVVPEPSSLILMLTGIAGAAGAIRRKSRR